MVQSVNAAILQCKRLTAAAGENEDDDATIRLTPDEVNGKK
jgi:hypothetical protein